MIDELTKLIQQAVPDSQVRVLDPMQDGLHLQAIVISPAFEGMPLVKQHRMVMGALNGHFGLGSLHALGLKTFTPRQWEESGAQQDGGL